MGARKARSTLAIGVSVALDGPAPMMIGAITICSRSRQPAAKKRETVSAPPSIKIRRNPRSASAAKIAAGAMWRLFAASRTTSTPGG